MSKEKRAAAASDPVTKSRKERLQIARSITPIIIEEADQGEALTRLTDKAVDAMKQNGLLHLLLPRELQGEEASLVEAMEIIELMSWADGAAGWYAMIANATAAATGSFLPDRGAEIIYGGNPRAMVAGQGGPRGKAKRVDGGYIINGPWSYGSTTYHAEFFVAGCAVVDESGKPVLHPDGSPRAIACHFPKAEGKLGGNWDTLGLRGTGSYDYDVVKPNLFVPDHMITDPGNDAPRRGGSQYSVGIVGLTALSHGAWAIGTARRALDEICKVAPQKSGPAGMLAASASFKQSFATAESKFRSAKAFLYETWRDIEATLNNGESVSVQQLALARMAMRHMHDVGSEVTTFAHRAGGGLSLRSSVLQRTFRDMHSATQHVLMADQLYQDCAHVMLGLVGPNARWTPTKISDD